jgi:calmodulin
MATVSMVSTITYGSQIISMALFTDEDRDNFQHAFDVFDDDRDGVVPMNLLGKLFRAVGFNPFPQEVEDMAEDLQARNSQLTFKAFYYLLCGHAKSVDPEAELVRAFRVFDKIGSGRLDVDVVKKILRSLKQPFTEDQIGELLSQADVDGQQTVDYADFSKLMLDF